MIRLFQRKARMSVVVGLAKSFHKMLNEERKRISDLERENARLWEAVARIATELDYDEPTQAERDAWIARRNS